MPFTSECLDKVGRNKTLLETPHALARLMMDLMVSSAAPNFRFAVGNRVSNFNRTLSKSSVGSASAQLPCPHLPTTQHCSKSSKNCLGSPVTPLSTLRDCADAIPDPIDLKALSVADLALSGILLNIVDKTTVSSILADSLTRLV